MQAIIEEMERCKGIRSKTGIALEERWQALIDADGATDCARLA
jgi:hypothetical protein